MVLLLLWQFRVRHMSTLAQTRAAEKRLQYEATHDMLTGLPNRTLFTKHLSRAMERARKDAGYAFAVLFLDLEPLQEHKRLSEARHRRPAPQRNRPQTASPRPPDWHGSTAPAASLFLATLTLTQVP